MAADLRVGGQGSGVRGEREGEGGREREGLTSVQAKHSLVADDFEETVKRVLVHDLPWQRASLVLHSCLHKVNRIHSSCSRS